MQRASVDTFHEFLIEVIPPRDMPCDEHTVAAAMEQIYRAGIFPDWWKLPPASTAQEWVLIAEVIERHDRHCRGVLVLGLEASEEALEQSFRIAAPHPVCKGFAVGRSIFADAASSWFAGRMSDAQLVADVAERYARLICLWDDARSAATSPAAQLATEDAN